MKQKSMNVDLFALLSSLSFLIMLLELDYAILIHAPYQPIFAMALIIFLVLYFVALMFASFYPILRIEKLKSKGDKHGSFSIY